MPAARGGVDGAAAGEGVSAPYDHLSVRHPEALSPIFDRMEQHARRREGRLQSAHLSLSLDDTRAHCEVEKASGVPTEHFRGHPSTDRGQSASREAETMQRSQPGAGVRLRSPFLRTKLLNPPGANACYINSTMLSLLHTCHHLQDSDALLGRMSTIRQAIQQNRRPILLRDMLTFRRLLSDWRAPTQQHDIGEFFQCLTQAGSMQLEQHSWQAREMRGEQLRVLDTGHLGTPIPLDRLR